MQEGPKPGTETEGVILDYDRFIVKKVNEIPVTFRSGIILINCVERPDPWCFDIIAFIILSNLTIMIILTISIILKPLLSDRNQAAMTESSRYLWMEHSISLTPNLR